MPGSSSLIDRCRRLHSIGHARGGAVVALHQGRRAAVAWIARPGPKPAWAVGGQKSTVAETMTVRGAPTARKPRAADAQYELSNTFSTMARTVTGFPDTPSKV